MLLGVACTAAAAVASSTRVMPSVFTYIIYNIVIIERYMLGKVDRLRFCYYIDIRSKLANCVLRTTSHTSDTPQDKWQ